MTHGRITFDPADLKSRLDYVRERTTDYEALRQLDIVRSMLAYDCEQAPATESTRAVEQFLERSGMYLTNDATREAVLAAERERCAALADGIKLGMPAHDQPHPVVIYKGDIGKLIRALT